MRTSIPIHTHHTCPSLVHVCVCAYAPDLHTKSYQPPLLHHLQLEPSHLRQWLLVCHTSNLLLCCVRRYAADQLTWLVTRSLGSAPMEIMAKLQEDIDECDRW